jgi:hypothetical protein
MKLTILLLMLGVTILIPGMVYFTLQLFEFNQHVIDGYTSVIAVTMLCKWLTDLVDFIFNPTEK